ANQRGDRRLAGLRQVDGVAEYLVRPVAVGDPKTKRFSRCGRQGPRVTLRCGTWIFAHPQDRSAGAISDQVPFAVPVEISGGNAPRVGFAEGTPVRDMSARHAVAVGEVLPKPRTRVAVDPKVTVDHVVGEQPAAAVPWKIGRQERPIGRAAVDG